MSAEQRPRFHLAFPVDDLAAARRFYGDLLGCSEGRSTQEWVDFNFHGHQLVAHLDTSSGGSTATNSVDGEAVPVRHFGLILSVSAWLELVARLVEHDTEFLIEPQVRFEGQVGEQHTCFFLDPSGNAIELKAFANDEAIFAS
ncbi:MAG: VOC family protein [Acidobacteria bacterium]|nr:VOC family protein [Acidobacteriota bacterium]